MFFKELEEKICPENMNKKTKISYFFTRFLDIDNCVEKKQTSKIFLFINFNAVSDF